MNLWRLVARGAYTTFVVEDTNLMYLEHVVSSLQALKEQKYTTIGRETVAIEWEFEIELVESNFKRPDPLPFEEVDDGK